jgi:selT/selW/selH-like putative selenoprotein
VKLVPGGGGQFDVIADGALCFSKKETGRFPEDEEVITALHRKLDAARE